MALETAEREHVVRGVAPRALYDVVTDYASYPKVFPEITSVRIVSETGNTKRVEFKAKVVMEVRYVIDIVHDPDKLQTRWTFVEGDVVTDNVGGWTFTPEGDGTKIHYRVGMAVKAPLPKFMISKITNMLVGQTLPNTMKAVEREALARARR